MSGENQGIHINLTAETSVFTTKIRAAQQSLTGLKSEASTLKAQEASLENSISKLSGQLEKKKKALDDSRAKLKAYEDASKGSSDEAERLRQSIAKQEEKIKQLTDKLNSNSRDLKENASAQDICANKIRLATEEVDKLTGEYSQNTQELRENEAANQSFTNTLKTGLMTLKGIALGYAGKTLYNALIGTNAEYEQYLTSFEVLLQSAEKAESMINNLDRFGADTPFELPDLTSATEQLLAFGTAEEDVMTRLQQLGDLSKGKADILERITLAYGKMQAKGKVTLEELNMLTEAGVPILRELAQQLGVTTDVLFKKISAGEINIEHINTAIQAMTSEGGQFFGMMEKQAQTMDGMMSTLGDNINIVLRQLGEGAFDAVKDEISELLAEIQRMNDDGSLKAFAEETGEGIADVVEIIAGAAKVVYNLKDVILVGANAWITYKSALAIISTLNALKNGFAVCKNAVELFRTAQLKGVTVSEMVRAKSLKEIAVKAGLTTATAKDTAAEATNTVAKNAQAGATTKATAAQTALNAAMSANPIGLVIAGISALVSVIGIFVGKSKEAKEASRQSAIEAGEAAQEEKKTVEALIDEYKELRTAGDWDNSARERAKEIQDELTKLVGKEAESLDLVNGKLSEQNRLFEISVSQAKKSASELYNAEQAAGANLWDEIKANRSVKFDVDNAAEWTTLKENINFSEEELKLLDLGKFNVSFDNFHEFLDKYPQFIKARDALYDAGLKEGEAYKELSEAIELYSEEYNAYMEKLSAWQENEASIHLGEYMKNNDINSKEAFDKYIESIDESKEHSEQYKEVLKQIANEAFPQYSNAAKDTADAVDGLGDSVKSTTDTLDTLKEVGNSLSSLGKAQEELSKSGKLSISTIADIKDNFSGLGDELDGYIERLIESNGNTEATRQVMGDMTNALIQNKFSTEELANADTGLIATMLEEAGVANSVEYATYLVNDAKAKTKVSTFDFANATEKEIGALYEDIKALGLTADEAKSLIAEKLALELQNAAATGTIDDFIAGLDDEAAALGITKDELLNLIYVSDDFNAMNLDVSQKIDALYALALQAYDTANALSTVQNISNTAGQIYNEWLTEHPGDYEGAEQARNEHLNWANQQFKSNLTKRTTYTPKYTEKTPDSPDKKEPTKNEQLEAYKNNIAEEDRLAERSNKRQREYGQITDKEFYNSLKARAIKYRNYAVEVLSLTYATEEEKAALNKEYIEKAEDLELEAYKGKKQLREKEAKEARESWDKETNARKSVYDKRYSNSLEWINERVEFNDYTEAYAGLDRVATYTNEFYATELQKLEEAYAQGILTADEYAEQKENIDEVYLGKQKNIAEKRKDILYDEIEFEKESYSERLNNSKDWINEQLDSKNFEAVYGGLDRIKVYTDEFYETELQKLKNALDEGMISQEEYLRESTKLTREYGENLDYISGTQKNTLDTEFLNYVDTANKYIADRNFYGDWSKWGDTEEQALARMFGNLDEWREKGVSNDVWINAYDELSKNIFEVSKENLLSAIEEEEEILREKYEKELNMKKEAAEKELEIAKEKANAEIDAINAKADAEIKRIDELIQKRKEAREDEDYNLRLQRLQMKLEYEHDEDNKTALRKEIAKLKEEISDMEFDREMKRQKELIEEKRDGDIAAVNARLEKDTATTNAKISAAEANYTEKTSDTAIANELATTFNYRGYEGIFESMGIDFADGISRGLQGILSAFNESFGEFSGSKSNYDYSSNSKTYNMYASFSGAQSETDIIRGLRKFLERLELEGRI